MACVPEGNDRYTGIVLRGGVVVVRLVGTGYAIPDRTGAPMTAGHTRELLRDHAEPQRATYVELFFDVILVFALTRLSHTLFTNLTWLGALHTVILLASFWWVWVFTAWTTNRLNPAQPLIQIVIIPMMFGTLLMAGAAPAAFAENGLIFATTYAVLQIGRPLFVTIALRGRGEVAIGSLQQLVWSSFSGAVWIAGAFTEGTSRVLIWLFAAALGFTMSRLEFRLPKIGPARIAAQPISAEHLAERYQQIMIVAFGETILASGGQFAMTGFERDRVIAFALAFATTTLMWRIYFYRAAFSSRPSSRPAPRRRCSPGPPRTPTCSWSLASCSVPSATRSSSPIRSPNPTWCGPPSSSADRRST